MYDTHRGGIHQKGDRQKDILGEGIYTGKGYTKRGYIHGNIHGEKTYCGGVEVTTTKTRSRPSRPARPRVMS